MADEKKINEAEVHEAAGGVEAPAAEATAAEAQSSNVMEEMLREMDALAVRMGILSGGVDYLIESGAPDEVVVAYMKRMDATVAEEAARQLNLSEADRERIKAPAERTAEERLLIDTITLKYYSNRIGTYIKSNYLRSIGIIAQAASEALGIEYEEIDPRNPDKAPLIEALNMLNRYFYIGMHKELNPLDEKSLGEAEVEELRKLAQDYISFHKRQDKAPAESVVDFISPIIGDIIGLTSQSDMTFLPISLVFRDQKNIAKRGAEGALENVGKRTDAGTVNVEAYISDKDGKPLNIDAVMQGVQAAIGQLIDENGRVLPIIVTPQQVYRAYARLPNDAVVTKQQAAEMERAIDSLMFSPSRLDFRAQLEKHKHIKHQADYDYKGKDAGRLTGNLITAEKGEATNRLGERQVAYKIYSVPVLYRYSHIVGQIAQVPNKFLTGESKDAIKDKKAAEAQRNALNVGMRRVVLSRITYWRGQLRRHQAINSALRIQEIADDCNIELTKKVEETLRKNIRQYLDELQSQRAIKKYQAQKDGRHVIGFYIYF